MPIAVSPNDEKKKVWINAQYDLGEYIQIQLFSARFHDNLCRELIKSHKKRPGLRFMRLPWSWKSSR
jgi:hypothetical protein